MDWQGKFLAFVTVAAVVGFSIALGGWVTHWFGHWLSFAVFVVALVAILIGLIAWGTSVGSR